MACEAYMKTDYSKLADDDFQQTLNDYLSYLVKEEKFLKHNIILIYYKKKPINQASFFYIKPSRSSQSVGSVLYSGFLFILIYMLSSSPKLATMPPIKLSPFETLSAK